MFENIICFLSNYNCKKINPIEYDKLLRSPGQSLNEKIDDIIDNSYQNILLLTLIYGFIAIYIPWIFIIYIIILLIIITITVNKVKPLKMGRDGEIAMSQYLHSIARESSNVYIFNDIVNSEKKYNIDHVVLSNNGIFIIDTKTYAKERGKTNTIMIKNNKLYKNNYPIELPAINGQAKWLQNRIEKELNKKYKITKIVAYIGWFTVGSKIDDIFITNAKNIKYILNKNSKINSFDENEFKKIKSILTSLSSNRKREICCNKPS
jgi:hypothetical protein